MTDTTKAADGTRDRDVAKLAELISDTQVCMFATMAADGGLISRPMAVQQVEFDGDLWFFTRETSRKVEQVHADARVNVSFASRSSWVSVAGTAEVVRDGEKAKALWNAGIAAWFPDGPEDPKLVLLKVHADGAEYWDTPGAVIASLLSFAKAQVTGKSYHVEDRKVDL